MSQSKPWNLDDPNDARALILLAITQGITIKGVDEPIALSDEDSVIVAKRIWDMCKAVMT